MARLVVRSKSHQKLRPSTSRRDTTDAQQVSDSRQDVNAKENFQYTYDLRPKNLAPPSFEVLSRPRTASAAMDNHRRQDLIATGSPISVTEGKDIFNFPTPLRRNPQPPAPLLSRYAMVPLERSDTPDTIGIALGSPSHLSQFENPLTQSPVQGRMCAPSREILTPVSTPRPSLLSQESKSEKSESHEPGRPKLSRWRSLGGLFARKPSNLDKGAKEQQRSAPSSTTPRLKDYHTWEHQSPPRKRSETNPRLESPKNSPRMGIGRSQTAPSARNGRNIGSPPPPPKDLLDVEIPSTKLDRYSVMFNGILPAEPGGLLARRQSKREISRPHHDNVMALDIPPVPKRRNTTTSPTASPSYRLLVFPPDKTLQAKSPGRKNSLLHRPRPLKRSNTAPGALSPGLRKELPLSPMSETPENSAAEQEEYPEQDELDRQALTPTPSEPSTPTTPVDGQSVHSYNPFHDRSASGHWDKELETSWEMITIGKVAEPGDRFSDAAGVRVVEDSSPVEQQPPQQRSWHPLRMNTSFNRSHTDLPVGNASPTAKSEVSQVQIARSMSVTKAQRARPVLKPRVVDAKMGERLGEMRVLTPTVVELVEVGADGSGGVKGGHGHTPKKSVCGIVETA